MDKGTATPYVVKTSGNTKLNPKNLNIDGSDDPFYRYKTRQLFIQVIGKGKMIKTVLLNVDDVAKDLKVPPSYMTAYLGYEIGAKHIYDSKKPDRERASISGDIDGKDLLNHVKKFIQEIVLCSNCKLPEITMFVDHNTKQVNTSCRSCGEKSTLNNLKPKFQQFILNHREETKSLVSKEEKSVKKKQDEAAGSTSENKGKAGEGESPGQREKPKGKTRRPKKDDDEEDDDDGIEWSASTSKEAVKARRREMLPDSVTEILDEKTAGSDPIIDLNHFIETNPDGDLVAEVKRLQKKYGFKNSKRAHLLFEIFFKNNASPDLEPHLKTFQQLIADIPAQKGVLDCIEKLCSVKEHQKKAIPLVKQFYESDIVEEQQILDWNRDQLQNNPELKKEMERFITWLQTAEEESDEE